MTEINVARNVMFIFMKKHVLLQLRFQKNVSLHF